MLDHKYVPLTRLIGQKQETLRAILGSDSGVYVWVRDIVGMAESPDLGKLLGWFQSPTRKFEGSIPPYLSIVASDLVPPLTAAKQQFLSDPRLPREDLRWCLNLATYVQRPLYIGTAGDFSVRINDHLARNSTLRGYLEESGIEVSECGIHLYAFARSEQLSEDERQILDHESGDDDSLLAPDGTDLTKTVRLAESLAIRLAQPFLNRRTE